MSYRKLRAGAFALKTCNCSPFARRARCSCTAIAVLTEAYGWSGRQISFSTPSASLIQCARHGALFLIESGECVAGPCEGEALHAIDCREDGEGIWIDL